MPKNTDEEDRILTAVTKFSGLGNLAKVLTRLTRQVQALERQQQSGGELVEYARDVNRSLAALEARMDRLERTLTGGETFDAEVLERDPWTQRIKRARIRPANGKATDMKADARVSVSTKH